MLTVEGLRAKGSKVEEGLARCMNNEALYLRLVGMALQDKNFEGLRAALAAGDARAAFEAAHALKGALANLALTPLCEPASAITELVRGADAGAPVPGTVAPYAEALFAALAEHLTMMA